MLTYKQYMLTYKQYVLTYKVSLSRHARKEVKSNSRNSARCSHRKKIKHFTTLNLNIHVRQTIYLYLSSSKPFMSQLGRVGSKPACNGKNMLRSPPAVD